MRNIRCRKNWKSHLSPLRSALSMYTLQILGTHYMASKLISLSIFNNYWQWLFSFKWGDMISDQAQPVTKIWWKETKRKWGQQLGRSHTIEETEDVFNSQITISEGIIYHFECFINCTLRPLTPPLSFYQLYCSDCWKCISCWICSMIRTMVVWQSDVLAAALITVIKCRLSKPTP